MDANLGRRVLDRVVEKVPDSRLELLGIAEHDRGGAARAVLVLQRRVVQVKARPRERDALSRDLAQVDTAAYFTPEPRAGASGPQHLLNGVQQPIAVVQHDAGDLAPLVGVQLARLQRLQVQANGSDRRLQLVGDRVQKRILLLVPPDFAHQKDGVQHHPGNDEEEEDEAKNGQHPGLPVEDDPADVEGNRDGDETDAEDGEEDHRTPAPANHLRSLPDWGSRLPARRWRLAAGGWRLAKTKTAEPRERF